MALYTDNSSKFIAVLNRKIELPKLLNALGHMSVWLTSLAEDVTDMQFLAYSDADSGSHPAISHFPYIVLAADNSNQIRTLRAAAIAGGILYNDFTSSMLGMSAEDQQNQTQNTKEIDLEYFGICLFGSAEVLQPLTKKFSLFR
jgi:Protein of unknown function (DUF2000)